MLKTISSIVNAIGALNYKGTWNASTNTPTLASGVGTKGDYYVVSVAGTTTLDGISTWYVGDWATFNGSVWQRLEGGADDPALSLKSNSTTGLMQITGPAAGQTRVVTIPDANATMARTDAAQSFTGDQTLATGNLIIGTSGKGIDFSATSQASGATSELLDDYEEGSFTPFFAFSGGGGSITHTWQFGNYTKIGNMVYCQIAIYTDSATLGSGDVVIQGLPFSTNSNVIYRGGCGAVGFSASWVTLAPTQIYWTENSTQIQLGSSVGSGFVATPSSNFNTGTGNFLYMSFTYPVS